VDRATLEAWARGEAAPSEAAAAATAAAVAAAPREEGGEAADEDAAAAEAEATEDATGPDLAMEGEQGFEAEEDDERPLATPPSEAELAYGTTSLRVARPKGYWAKAPTEAAADAPPTANTAPAAYTGIAGGTGEVSSGTGADAHGHSLAADGTVVHGSATPVVDRYDAALRTAQRIEEIAISANQIAQIAPAVTDVSAASAQPGGPWAPPLFNSLPEVDRATLEAWARGEAAPSEAAKALEGSSVSSVASGRGGSTPTTTTTAAATESAATAPPLPSPQPAGGASSGPSLVGDPLALGHAFTPPQGRQPADAAADFASSLYRTAGNLARVRVRARV